MPATAKLRTGKTRSGTPLRRPVQAAFPFAPPDEPNFDGLTYEPAKDHKRLSGQLHRVRALMADGEWRTLAEIAAAVNGSEAGVSARLRDLRKEKFGRLRVDRRRVEGGLWEYRVEGGLF